MSMRRLILILLTITLGAPAASAQPDPRAKAKQLLAKFDYEPNVVEVQRAASRYAKVNPDAYDSWITEAHLAYLLPKKLDGRFRRVDAKDKDVRTTSASQSLSDLVADDEENRFEVRAEWDLTRLVFNKDAISATRQIERLVNQREDILTTVNKLYYARRQAQVEMELNPPSNVKNALRMQLRVDGLTADLDALTGGWFSRTVAERRPAGR